MKPGFYLALCALSGCLISSPQNDLRGQDVHLTVIHTSDIHSRFFPYYFAPGLIDQGLGLKPPRGRTTMLIGGISRISTVVKCIRGMISGADCDAIADRTGPPAARAIHVDSGDIFQGAPVFNVFGGEVEMKTMSMLGLTAMVAGNHEFDKGGVNLSQQKQNWGGFPMLAANYEFQDVDDPTSPNKLGRDIVPWHIAQVGGLKVGMIGMANLSSIQSIIEGGNSLGIRPIEAKQAIGDAVRALRSQVDVLTIVSHLGLDEDEDVAVNDASGRDENVALDQSGLLDEVDIIFGGHLHIILNPPKDLPHFDRASGAQKSHTVLVHSGAFAKYIGRADFVIHVPSDAEAAQGMRSHVKSYGYRVIPIDDSIPEDAEMVRVLEPYYLKMNTNLNLTQQIAVVPCPDNVGSCPKIQRNSAEGGDSQLGNLVAQSMRLRERVEADFALTNSLGIRADFESGPLDLEQMYNVFPFENTITTMNLSGQEVQEMLDFVAARSSERGCRSQVQVAGIYFDLVCSTEDPECRSRLGVCVSNDVNKNGQHCSVDADCPTAADAGAYCRGRPCSKNVYLGDSCRLPDGSIDMVRCDPLGPFSFYRVAVNDYIAAGGSGFSVLKRNTTKFNTGISLRDSLIDFMRNLPNRCTADQGYINLKGVYCRNSRGERYDCTADCDFNFDACARGELGGEVRSPERYNLSGLPCIAPDVEPPDGRIRALAGAGN